MAENIQPMQKSEIAKLLQVSIEDVYGWVQTTAFGDWFDVCPEWSNKIHDETDIVIFTLISQINHQLDKNIAYDHRIKLIKQVLYSSPVAVEIRERRKMERFDSKNARWSVVADICLRYDYEWLKPLQPSINRIVSFGCWASDSTCTSSEPYALLWTLEGTKILVIDKEPEYVQNAQLWLEATKKQHPYFEEYDLKFVVGDMTQKNLVETIDSFDVDTFDLSYCCNVLYYMYKSSQALQDSIDTMAKAVKPGGWVIAVEPKMGVEFENKPCDLFNGALSMPVPMNKCKDISKYFEAAGLIRSKLDDAPECSYCYRKA